MAAEIPRPPSVDLDPFGEEFLADPYAFHSTLREAGPVVHFPVHGIYGMARHAEVQAALKDWQGFCSSRGAGLADFARETPWRTPSLLIESDPPVHDRIRSIVGRVMSLASLKQHRPRWRQGADELVGELVERRSFDAIKDLAERFPLMVFPDLVGMQDGAEEHLLPYAALGFNAFGPRNRLLAEAQRNAERAIPWIADSCRRENLKQGGWGAQVYEAVDRGECSEDEAALLVRSFLSAGVDTTVNGLGNMLLAFITFPDQWRRLREQPNLIKRAFDESLRWDSTVQTFFRTTPDEVIVDGFAIPANSKVVLFLAAANRDPRRWTDPDHFDLGRATSGHVAFGFGIHQCLGQMLARFEAEVVLEALLERVDTWDRAGPVVRRLNNTLHALESMPVRVS